VAPEYVTRGILTEKADVYSYGVLLMEIVTGKVHMSRTLTGCLFFLVDEVSHPSQPLDPHIDTEFTSILSHEIIKWYLTPFKHRFAISIFFVFYSS
jgi:hypothetical protein